MQDKPHSNTYSPLEQLSTEEIERLLCTSDGEEPDVDFIIKAMEVIQFREKGNPSTQQIDVDAAWKEFQEDYKDNADAFASSTDSEMDYSNENRVKPIRKVFPLFRRVAVVAIVVFLLNVTTTAFGFDLFRVIAKWTADTFHFTSQDTVIAGQADPENDPFASIREAVAEYTDTPVIPTWAPEGTEEIEKPEIIERVRCTSIVGRYHFAQNEFSIQVQIYEHPPELDDTIYQKDDGETIVVDINGITHFVFSNLDTSGVAWVSGNNKSYIQGNLTVEDLRQMIDSIYKE